MIPRLHFAHLPTPVEELRRLSKVLGGPRLLVKRDDQTGLAFGGNKTRKLEFLIAEAQAEGAQTLITGGAMQSNHCRQTAAAAARFGLGCVLVLTGELPREPSANILLDLFSAPRLFLLPNGANAIAYFAKRWNASRPRVAVRVFCPMGAPVRPAHWATLLPWKN